MEPLITMIISRVCATPPCCKQLRSWVWCSYATLLLLLSFVNSAFHTTAGVVAVAAAAAATPSAPGGGLSGNETDRLSLLSFKDAVFGDPTGALGSWNDSIHYCQWRGVTCGRRHPDRVTALNLTSLSLSGHISPSLANLTFLREMDLSDNQLRGAIPPQLGALSRLRALDLSNNSLSGSIPSNLSRCSVLVSLSLYDNRLMGEIPVALGSLPKLVYLNINRNRLTGAIPPSLGNLSSNLFQTLALSGNALTGAIPCELGRLKNLDLFGVALNKLSGTIPPSLYNLSNLGRFLVTGNQFLGTLPSDLGTALPKLRHLTVGGNQFQGSIPTSLSNASSLQTIDLAVNMFKGTIPDNLGTLKELSILNVNTNRLEAREPKDWAFFTSLTNCTRLRFLALTRNDLQGALPNSIANFSATLQLLAWGKNQISGRIPLETGNLVGLTGLGMGGNKFIGSIPPTLGKLNKLVLLELNTNQFTGEIPTELGNLTQLSQLFLYDNYLSGNIPTSISRCQQLQTLDISDNSLNASIPEDLLTIPTLVELDLSDNYLEGPLPSRMGRLLGLRTLHLSSNRLSGSLPTALGDCQSMEELYLQGNSFEGTVPSSLRMLKGIVPDFLAEYKFLQYLNLSFNNFTGEVPTGGMFENASAVSLLGNKMVCGGIPALQLPLCASDDKKRNIFHSPKVIVSIAIGALCLLLSLCFITYRYWMRKPRGEASIASSFETKYKVVSYRDLVKATDGFSHDNLIGSGSFGSVYKGVLDDENIVAVKVFNLQNEGASKSFRSECETLRNIRHRNLVKIVSVCSSIDYSGNDFKAMVFEFFPNGSLEKWLHPGTEAELRSLDFGQRLCIAIDVASALNYLHNGCPSPIVHCDLKPNNVLIDDNKTAHVGDFGLARFIQGPSSENLESQSSTIGMKGTIGYVAPEYGMGSPVSVYGDIYSFGILLLELFTAKRPTDNMFKDGWTLQKFVETALPERAMDVIDPSLLPQNDEVQPLQNTENYSGSASGRVQGCFVSLMQIGLSCTKESPKERKTMGHAVKEIHLVQDAYLKATRCGRTFRFVSSFHFWESALLVLLSAWACQSHE